MKLYIDTANTDDIRRAYTAGIIDGVTTNPSIISKEKKPFRQCIAEIREIGPDLTILAEVISKKSEEMVAEAEQIAALAAGIVVKLPATSEGISAVRRLSRMGISTTVTLVFSLNQAIAASSAGTDFVAPFVGRLDDIDSDGCDLIRAMSNLFRKQGVKTQIIAASLRSSHAVSELFAAGADIITAPYSVLSKMLSHPLTDNGLARFEQDWKSVPQGV